MLTALGRANPLELVLAACFFAAALGCTAASWRVLLSPRLGYGEACMRYSVGSLVNSFLPARGGDAVRIGLFGRVVTGGALTVIGAVAAVGTIRWLALVPLAAVGVSPKLALLAPGAIVVPIALAWLWARRGGRRASALIAPIRASTGAARAWLIGWVCGTVLARLGAATLAGTALGVPHPVAAALLVVPALELSGIVPITPGGVGVVSGAAALAFHARGASLHQALAAGLVMHATETATSLLIGGSSATVLWARARKTQRPGAGPRALDCSRLLRRVVGRNLSEPTTAMGKRPVTVQ